VIDYETYCKLVALHRSHQMRPAQIARTLSMDVRTVLRWIEAGTYRPRIARPRASRLDAYKPQILQWIETYEYTGVQILRRLRESGYEGGKTVLNDYLARVRPRRNPAFLTLSFAPGECAQVDWGEFGSIRVGSTQRRLSFFVMVLCYSRMMYVEFTVSQSLEHFLACHQNAFHFFGAVPENIMVDNLKSAVLRRLIGQAPVFHPRYLDLSQYFGFQIKACGVAKGNEKGRVENAVGYIKKNFLGGLDFPDFSVVNPAAREWLDTVANVRVHGVTHKKPLEMFQETERAAMRPLPDRPYEVAVSRPARANNRFRVTLDTNRYSVPAEYASQRLILKAYPERLCLYHQAVMIAQHVRSYDRHQDFEHPDHPRVLLAQRHAAREQRLLQRFLQLSPQAEAYYRELQQRRMNPRHHIRQIVALSEIYGPEKTARVMQDAFVFQAFSCEYIANLLEQRERLLPEPGALHLTRRQDLLELELPEPDLLIYEPKAQEPKGPDEYNNPHR
jgi:transposase